MTSLPFSPAATATLLVFCLIGVGACVMLLARRKLTMGYTLVWIGVIAGLAALVSVPHLAQMLTGVLSAQTPDGLLRLLAFITIVAFLIFFSMKVSELTHRIEDLAQRVALFDHEQRRSRQKPSDPS